MKTAACKLALSLAAGALLTGCGQLLTPVRLNAADVTPRVDYSDLAAVLAEAVDDDGLLVAKALKASAERLDSQLRLMAVTGPTASPHLLADQQETLAYWYNARAAWSMKLALVCDCPKRLNESQLTTRLFSLDGRDMSIDSIDAVLRSYDDWRVEVCSPGVTMCRARLPDRPFTGQDVRQRIEERLSEFVDDPQRFVIDVERKRIFVPCVLWQYRNRLLEAHRAAYGTQGANLTSALLPYVEGSAHRRLQDAIGYQPVRADRQLLPALQIEDWRIGL